MRGTTLGEQVRSVSEKNFGRGGEDRLWSLTDRCREECWRVFKKQETSQKEDQLLQSAEIWEMAEPANIILWKEVMQGQEIRTEGTKKHRVNTCNLGCTHLWADTKLSKPELEVLTLFTIHLVWSVGAVESFITLQVGVNAAAILASEEGGLTVPIAHCTRNSSDRMSFNELSPRLYEGLESCW